MYWISVTALGALYYFYLKGRKKNEPVKNSVQTAETLDASPGVFLDQEDIFGVVTHISDPWERHLAYVRYIDPAYKKRAVDKKMHDLAMDLATAYINEFSEIKAMVFDNLGEAPKVVAIFKQLAILFEEDHEYEKAIEVCRTAMAHGISDGTKTGYEGRMERINNKLKKIR